ncbi:hypothetical protein NDU88_008002 [Pleurodeles waltl]|uniref:Uncharacterized protein n=1 Tax=Pleurodeles waltl TaxID=8319 RepID=A0AAV7RWQ3_PLEWA|nr:hypothetical protein NDU88_008002 [Pleurodeles waltl]
MEIDSSPIAINQNEEEEMINESLNDFIQVSVDQAVSVPMTTLTENLAKSVLNLVSKTILAQSTGDSRKHPLPKNSAEMALLIGASSSQKAEDVAPHRPPLREGISTTKSSAKCSMKTKHISSPIVISKILDTDNEMGDAASEADKSDMDNDDPFNAPPPKKSKLSSSNSASMSDSQGVPMFDPSEIHHPQSTEWFPAEHVGEYVASRLRTPLDKQTRTKLRSECPRPLLHSNMSSTPSIDPSLITFFTKFGKGPRKGVDKAWSTCQEKLLDVVGPLKRIFDLAESARLEQAAVNPKELSLWCTMGCLPLRQR